MELANVILERFEDECHHDRRVRRRDQLPLLPPVQAGHLPRHGIDGALQQVDREPLLLDPPPHPQSSASRLACMAHGRPVRLSLPISGR
jgi:hypothetical protein